MDDLTDREIRAMLRGATKVGVLDGWYWHGFPPNLRWVINAGGQTTTYNHAGIVSYCEMLTAAEVEPVYRMGDRRD